MLIHDQRADLMATFPEPLGASREAFARWFVTYGRLEYSLPRRVVGPVLRSLPLRGQVYARLWWLRHAGARRRATTVREAPALPAEAPVGAPDAGAAACEARPGEHSEGASTVTVVGWSASPTGVGEACRGTLAALEAERIPYSLVSLNHPELDHDEPLLESRRAAIDPRSPILLCHVNADMMATVRRELPRSVEAGKHVIGYWFWELSHFPLALAESFRFVDEVWAPSRFCQRAFSALAPCEVRWVPPGVRLPATGAFDRFELDVPRDAFLFFFAFDALSVPERKNPAGLLKAFARVVEELGPKRVHLLLKISHTERNPQLVKRLRRLAKGLPVTVMARALRRTALQGLFAASDAYVSLHRSEGLGLPLIESMFLDKPVIATDYGGCTDFVDETTSWPVRYRLESLSQAHGPYPAGAAWADPDVEHAAEQMLEVVLSPELRKAKTAAARRRVEELYAPGPAGQRFRAELDRVVELGEGDLPSAPRVRRRLVS
jgi:glycosyltransferase involved in cell wall biosynthesis